MKRVLNKATGSQTGLKVLQIEASVQKNLKTSKDNNKHVPVGIKNTFLRHVTSGSDLKMETTRVDSVTSR